MFIPPMMVLDAVLVSDVINIDVHASDFLKQMNTCCHCRGNGIDEKCSPEGVIGGQSGDGRKGWGAMWNGKAELPGEAHRLKPPPLTRHHSNYLHDLFMTGGSVRNIN